jgi:aerobic-type carbon monoxide dehydrogenase small subunit (CoxS/CutS family)
MFASAAYPVREVGMAASLTIRVNDELHEITADPDTPLLYVLINDLALNGPRFGCGLSQCGSCSVLADGVEIRSCVTPVARVAGKSVTTLEGLPAWYAKQRGLAQPPALHPLQQAFVETQAVQCGACYNGMTIKGAELLARNPHPEAGEIREFMDGHICRCGSYPRILKAIQLAATKIAGETP